MRFAGSVSTQRKCLDWSPTSGRDPQVRGRRFALGGVGRPSDWVCSVLVAVVGGVAVNDSRYARLVSALGEIGCAATVGDVPGVVAAAEGAELSEVRQLIEELPLDDPLVGPLSVAHALCVVVAAHDGVEVAGSMPRIASIANRLTGLFNDLDAQVAV